MKAVWLVMTTDERKLKELTKIKRKERTSRRRIRTEERVRKSASAIQDGRFDLGQSAVKGTKSARGEGKDRKCRVV